MLNLNDGYKDRTFQHLSMLTLRPDEVLRIAERTQGPVYLLRDGQIAFMLLSTGPHHTIDGDLGSANKVELTEDAAVVLEESSASEATELVGATEDTTTKDYDCEVVPVESVISDLGDEWLIEVEGYIDQFYEALKPKIPQSEWLKQLRQEGQQEGFI